MLPLTGWAGIFRHLRKPFGFDGDIFMTALLYALILFVGLFVVQVLSASLAARYTGNFDWPESLMIGFGMLGRAELAFVVLDIVFVQHSIISTEAFYTLMMATFFLNISVPLTIRWWKNHFAHTIPTS